MTLLCLPALTAQRTHLAADWATLNGSIADLRRGCAGWSECEEAACGDEEGTENAGYFFLDVAHGFVGNKVMG